MAAEMMAAPAEVAPAAVAVVSTRAKALVTAAEAV